MYPSLKPMQSSGMEEDLKDLIQFFHESWPGTSSPLTCAASDDNRRIIELLLLYGAAIDEPDKSGCTALHIACENGSISTMVLLLDSGARLNLRMIVSAMYRGDYETYNYLLRRIHPDNRISTLLRCISDARVLLVNRVHPLLGSIDETGLKTFRTSIKSVIYNHTPEILPEIKDYLVQISESDEPLIEAIMAIDKEGTLHTTMCNIIKHLIEMGGDPNVSDPLLVAVKTKNLEISKFLLEQGANPDCMRNGYTPLMTAVQIQNIDLIQLLLEHNADLNYPKYNFGGSMSVLKLAIQSGNSDIIRFLREFKAAKRPRPNLSSIKEE
jgi:ankyrin repeat protein